MRNISFMITPEQIRNETKDVTRRVGWWFLKPGDLLQGCEKCQGLKKGEKIKHLKVIEVVSIRPEPLSAITPEDVVREGFPDMTTGEFMEMFCKSHKGCTAQTTVNRIEFKYVGETNEVKAND